MLAADGQLRPGDRIIRRAVDQVTLENVVRWAGAVDDYTPLHYDPDAAHDRGLPGAVVHGPWKSALLAHYLLEWGGKGSALLRLDCRYRRPDVVGRPLAFMAEVEGTSVHEGRQVVDCKVHVHNSAGEATVVGHATLMLAGSSPLGDSPKDPGPDTARERLLLGQEFGRFTHQVGASDIDRFVRAVGPPDEAVAQPPRAPTDHQRLRVAPPTFFAALDPVERGDVDAAVPAPASSSQAVRRENAFSEATYERPIREGDVISVVTTFTEAYEGIHPAGRSLTRIWESELLDEDGALVGRTRCGDVLVFAAADTARP